VACRSSTRRRGASARSGWPNSGPRAPEPAVVGRPWKRAEVALFETLATIGTGLIETIKVHDGLPVALEIRQQV